MGEVVGALIRLLAGVFAGLVTGVDLVEMRDGRRRKKRLRAVQRGEVVEFPCVLMDPVLTEGARTIGSMSVRGGVYWKPKGHDHSTVFRTEPLSLAAVDKYSVTFRSEDGRTELRMHPDEATYVLSALS